MAPHLATRMVVERRTQSAGSMNDYGLENSSACVVDQHVQRPVTPYRLSDHCLRYRLVREIAGMNQGTLICLRCQAVCRRIDLRLVEIRDQELRTFGLETFRNRIPDTLRSARNDRNPSLNLSLHTLSSIPVTPYTCTSSRCQTNHPSHHDTPPSRRH